MTPTDPKLIGGNAFMKRIKDLEERVRRQQIRPSPNSGITVTETANGTVISSGDNKGGGGGSSIPRWG